MNSESSLLLETSHPLLQAHNLLDTVLNIQALINKEISWPKHPFTTGIIGFSKGCMSEFSSSSQLSYCNTSFNWSY